MEQKRSIGDFPTRLRLFILLLNEILKEYGDMEIFQILDNEEFPFHSIEVRDEIARKLWKGLDDPVEIKRERRLILR